MRWSSHHFHAIDVALAKGLTLNIRGKKVTFSPLTLDDLATVVATTRAQGLQIWREHQLSRGINQNEYRIHSIELNAILFGQMPQATIDYMSNPLIRKLILTLSIGRSLPADRKSEAESIAHEVLDCNDDEAAQLVEAVVAATVGPRSPTKPEEGADGQRDPMSNPSLSGG